MKNIFLSALTLAAASIFTVDAQAQLNSNPDKFLGNITTWGSPNGGGYEFATLWDQMTCENESKWSSCESNRNNFSWGGADQAYNYCKSHKIPFKWHALIWGAQYPGWIESLTPEQRFKEIDEWMKAIKKRYPDLEIIDVANECIEGHQKGTPYFIEALGGKGQTGWDWLIKAFEMAHELWPDAILIYNDFNSIRYDIDRYIELVTTLRDAGAPIDAYGCQCHELTGCGINEFKSSMQKLQNALKMPMYSTEYDIGTSDDDLQKTNYSEQVKYMWEQDYVAGVTLWGYIYGRTWTEDGNSGIIKDGKDRPAMTWLREYMKTDAAKKAKSPFPGMKKECSLYIRPSAPMISTGEASPIELRAHMRTKTIDHIDFYANNKLVETVTEAPYVVNYTPSSQGKVSLKAVLTATDGSTYERYGAVSVGPKRGTYGISPISLPGTLQAENFDKGIEGVSYHDSDNKNQGSGAFRTNEGGVDIDNGASGKVISYTENGEWLEYTINVKTPGLYSYEAYAVAAAAGSAFSLALHTEEGLVPLTEGISVPVYKEGSWTTYKGLWGRTMIPLPEGKQILRVTFDKGGCNLDRIVFKQVEVNEEMAVDVEAAEEPLYVGENNLIKLIPNVNEDAVKDVMVYIDELTKKTVSSAPFEFEYKPTAVGDIVFKAIATDTAGVQSKIVYKTIHATKRRSPYSGTYAELPGTIEFENFDVCGEGLSFHDSDTKDEGKVKYRTDNEGIDIFKGNEGYVVGNNAVGEWLEYTVDVKVAGTYSYEMIMATDASTVRLRLSMTKADGSEKTQNSTKSCAAKKNLDQYNSVKSTSTYFNLTEGLYIFRIEVLSNSGPCNLDKVIFTCPEADAVESIEASPVNTYDVYNVNGIYMGQIRVPSSSAGSDALYNLTRQHGIYIMKNVKTGETKSVKG